MPLVAGIDLGTQSTKLIVYDVEKKETVATAQATHDLIARDDGTREQEASWWLHALHSCFAEISQTLKKDIVAVGVGGQQHGFVPLSSDGKVLHPVKLWNDTSTFAECEQIHQNLGGQDKVQRLAGNPILPGYTASKVLWLKNQKPELYRQLTCILLPHDYLNYYLTGNLAAEWGDASGTGFMDVRTRGWHQEILEAIDDKRDWQKCLPSFVEPLDSVGKLRPQVARDLGLGEHVRVSAGGGDNMMGAIGTGCVKAGILTISLGTSGTLYGFSDTPVVSEKNEFAAFCSSSGGWLPLVCTMNCTAATELVRDVLQVDLDVFDGMLSDSQVGADGIVTLPFFDGERTPNLPEGKACMFGMTSRNFNRKNLLRSVVESTVFGLKTGLGAMQRQGLSANEVRLIGGGANSQVWCQIMADVMGMRVTRPNQPETVAFGAAMQAWCCYQNQTGGRVSLDAEVDKHLVFDPARTCDPIVDNREQYAQVFRTYQQYLGQHFAI